MANWKKGMTFPYLEAVLEDSKGPIDLTNAEKVTVRIYGKVSKYTKNHTCEIAEPRCSAGRALSAATSSSASPPAAKSSPSAAAMPSKQSSSSRWAMLDKSFR